MSLHGVCMIVYESSKISHPGISSSDLTTRLNFIAGRVHVPILMHLFFLHAAYTHRT
jgi:hypothetical protein